jgi:tRNA(Phe) wybutosine-synthesizing methylase Tyw3
MEMTPAEQASLSALIDQCLKVLKESNERSERLYAEIERDRAERQKLIQQFEEMLKVEKSP